MYKKYTVQAIYEDAIKQMKEVVREKLRTFGSAGRI